MATLMSVANRISPFHISNKVVSELNTDGASAMLVEGKDSGIKLYKNLEEFENDFAESTPEWANARSYFAQNGESVALFAISYAASNDTTPTDPNSSKATNTSSQAEAAIAAVKKYFYAGWSFLILPKFDVNLASGLSSFFEMQNVNQLIIQSHITLDLQAFAGNMRTILLSLPATDANDDEFNNDGFGGAFASAISQLPPHAAIKYAVGDLPFIKPQDRYGFTPEDIQEKYDPYGIITYAYVGDTARLTSSLTAATNIHIDTIRGWDWIQTSINQRLNALFTGAGDTGIPYNEAGFASVANTFRSAFLDAYQMGIIAPMKDEAGNETGAPDYSVTYKTPGQLPQSYATKREMRGVETRYRPMGLVEDIYAVNTIEL